MPQAPMTPGDDIAQGAPADIGSLSPIVQIIKLLMGGGGQQPPPVQPPMQGPGMGTGSLRDQMLMKQRAEQLSAPGGMGY